MRKSGILMHITSLPNPYGIGTVGKCAFDFIDFLHEAGQSYWQILPLNPTGYGDSPYQSCSAFAGNPYLIDLDLLVQEGLLRKEEPEAVCWTDREDRVDFSRLYEDRLNVLRLAWHRFDQWEALDAFCLDNSSWLPDFALFMALKYESGQKHFYEWDESLRRRDRVALNEFAKSYKEEILFWQFVQYEAKRQWMELKKYANSKGISIIGDMPIYVALDSVDVWKNPELFKLDENFAPKKVAGVPPDYFCEKGQLWGNPVYDYEVHKKDGFSWWIERIKKALKIYDYVRIDHFRAFDRYYEINSNAEDATVGEWIDVPSKELFDEQLLTVA